MQGIAAQIERLRARIADIERRPLLGAALESEPHPSGPIATPPGQLHEVFSDDLRSAGAALGFALGQARSLISASRPALILLQIAQEAGEGGLPYGPGLFHFGLDPAAVTFVTAESIPDLLWALEEAVVCTAVAAVVVDLVRHHKTLDFTASRRLALRAEAAGTSAFLVRYGSEREASAARFRWRVLPAPSAHPAFDARAPGLPRFTTILEKGRLGSFAEGTALTLDWTAKDGFALVEPGNGRRAATRKDEPAVSGTQPAALGDRLSQTG